MSGCGRPQGPPLQGITSLPKLELNSRMASWSAPDRTIVAFRRKATGFLAIYHRLFGDIPPASRRYTTGFSAIFHWLFGDIPLASRRKADGIKRCTERRIMMHTAQETVAKSAGNRCTERRHTHSNLLCISVPNGLYLNII